MSKTTIQTKENRRYQNNIEGRYFNTYSPFRRLWEIQIRIKDFIFLLKYFTTQKKFSRNGNINFFICGATTLCFQLIFFFTRSLKSQHIKYYIKWKEMERTSNSRRGLQTRWKQGDYREKYDKNASISVVTSKKYQKWWAIR